MVYTRDQHQKINETLKSFNQEFFYQNSLLFGGGTRIVLELNEYRISRDLEIICPSRESYRAVREQVNNDSLGALLMVNLDLPRGVRTDRDAIRTIAMVDGMPVKIEFIKFENSGLRHGENASLFPISYLDKTSCFCIKLLANADRYNDQELKDVFDILAMVKEWGGIPERAIEFAEKQYSSSVILPSLDKALDTIINDSKRFHESVDHMGIDSMWARDLMYQANKLKRDLSF